MTDKYDYKRQPWYRFGKAKRTTLGTGPLYNYHDREDLDVINENV